MMEFLNITDIINLPNCQLKNCRGPYFMLACDSLHSVIGINGESKLLACICLLGMGVNRSSLFE